MTTDDKRAKFCPCCGAPRDWPVSAPPVAATVATSSPSGAEGQEELVQDMQRFLKIANDHFGQYMGRDHCSACADPVAAQARATFLSQHEAHPAPHVKVTEFARCRLMERLDDGYRICPEHGDSLGVDGLVPPEAIPTSVDDRALGPWGRIRVTVEWWPEEQP